MRLARRALFAALAMLMLCAAVSTQTLRNENDPRNQSPSVGTGGPEGGPTGLFTIYDGSTIRKGEFTFSLAYSNFDRDPGDVDISDIPLSFNVGLNDHIELFFKTNAYRGIKVNSPLNLSSFYLPNSQVNCGALSSTGTASRGTSGLCSPAAIILAPSGPSVGNLGGTALFRPLNNQPFVQFPFFGASAGTFQQGPGFRGSLFGFPGFAANLGPGVTTPNSGTFSAADNFPGIGSPVGSILPGVVLSTVALPCTVLTGNCRPGVGNAGAPQNAITVPTTFTIAPSYLPDAPFVNRLYGESSFTNYVAGAKIRLTGPNNPLGVGLIPFYRWYPDQANSFSGFNQMQRGAGPGGDIGDFGLIGFIDGRLSRSVNVSANFGYILNSNPKSNFGTGTDLVLLDRPDELIAGIGFDFPVTKHFQPVAELRSTQYVAGRTPNAFENSPVEGLVGIKVYPRRYMGFGVAYRRAFNQQSASMFNNTDFNTQINQVSGVTVPGRGVVIVPGTTRPATTLGLPNGFRESSDPNGFIGQFWIGRRNLPEILTNCPPEVELNSPPAIVQPTVCSSCEVYQSDCTPSATQVVTLIAKATDPDGDQLYYDWNATPPTGGKITADGPNASWDLTGVEPGTYTATVVVDDGCGGVVTKSTTVTVSRCKRACTPIRPSVSISGCPTEPVTDGRQITLTANIAGVPAGLGNSQTSYQWVITPTVPGIPEQNMNQITIDTGSLPAGSYTATVTVTVDGCAPVSYSCPFVIPNRTTCKAWKFDSYCFIKFNDEKARLDNFSIELQRDPARTEGYYVISGGREPGQAEFFAKRAIGYLSNTRKINSNRLHFVTRDADNGSQPVIQLWIIPNCIKPDAFPAEYEQSITTGISETRLECKPRRQQDTRHNTPHKKKRRRKPVLGSE